MSWTTSWARAKACILTTQLGSPKAPPLTWGRSRGQKGGALPLLHAITQPSHAQALLPRRLASTESIAPDEISRDAAVSESAGHAQVLPEQAEGADEDEHTHSRRTVGEHVQFVRGNTCPGFRRVWQSRSALHPPPLTHFQICSPRTCVHATSLLRRTADLAANRWPEPPLPTDLPTPALVISLPHLLLLRPLGSGLFPCFGSMRAPQP